MSDSLIAVEDALKVDLSLVTWPSYYTGQCLICAGFLELLQRVHSGMQTPAETAYSMFGKPVETKPVH
jgi:hypothetical protein